LTGDFKAGQVDIAEDVMNWMKGHTLRDLTDIALEMEESGENAGELWTFIRELNGLGTEEVMELESSGVASEEPAQA